MHDYPVLLLNSALSVVAFFDDYESAFFIRSLYSAGSFSFVIDSTKAGASLIARDGFLVFGEDGQNIGIVKSVVRKTQNGRTIITVTGKEAKEVFSRRITIPATGLDVYSRQGTAEYVAKKLVDDQVISAVDTKRRIPNLELVADSNRGARYILSSRFKNIADELNAIATATDCGYRVYLDMTTKKLKFDMIVGLNRTSNQSTNARAIFDIALDTAYSSELTDSDSKLKTLVYAGGQGIGDGRTIAEVSTGEAPSGLERREIFLDSRDLSDTADIIDRAASKLAELGQSVTVDAEENTGNSPLVFGSDYEVGDLVTVVSDGVAHDVVISEVKFNYGANKFYISLTFGKPRATISDQLASVASVTQQVSSFSELGSNAEYAALTEPKYMGKYLDSAPTATAIGDSYLRYSTSSGASNRGVFYWDGTNWVRTEARKYIILSLSDISFVIAYKNTSGVTIYGTAADYTSDSVTQTDLAFFQAAVIGYLEAKAIKVRNSIRAGDRYDEDGAVIDPAAHGVYQDFTGKLKADDVEISGAITGATITGATINGGSIHGGLIELGYDAHAYAQTILESNGVSLFGAADLNAPVNTNARIRLEGNVNTNMGAYFEKYSTDTSSWVPEISIDTDYGIVAPAYSATFASVRHQGRQYSWEAQSVSGSQTWVEAGRVPSVTNYTLFAIDIVGRYNAGLGVREFCWTGRCFLDPDGNFIIAGTKLYDEGTSFALTEVILSPTYPDFIFYTKCMNSNVGSRTKCMIRYIS